MPPLALTALFAALALLLLWMAQPLIGRSVGPNGTFGLRTAATLADPAVWYEANARCGRDLQRLGALLLGGALVLPWTLGDVGGRVLVALLLGGLVIVLLRGQWNAHRLLRERLERLGDDARDRGVDP